MPADFDKCVRDGGRVRRKTLKDSKYINICFKDGKSHAGEVHEKSPTKKAKEKK